MDPSPDRTDRPWTQRGPVKSMTSEVRDVLDVAGQPLNEATCAVRRATRAGPRDICGNSAMSYRLIDEPLI